MFLIRSLPYFYDDHLIMRHEVHSVIEFMCVTSFIAFCIGFQVNLVTNFYSYLTYLTRLNDFCSDALNSECMFSIKSRSLKLDNLKAMLLGRRQCFNFNFNFNLSHFFQGPWHLCDFDNYGVLTVQPPTDA